jgi:beta propeller repeat protein
MNIKLKLPRIIGEAVKNQCPKFIVVMVALILVTLPILMSTQSNAYGADEVNYSKSNTLASRIPYSDTFLDNQEQISMPKIPISNDKLNQLEEYINGIDDEMGKQKAQRILRQVITEEGEIDVAALIDVVQENYELISDSLTSESGSEILDYSDAYSSEMPGLEAAHTSTVYEPPYGSCFHDGETEGLSASYESNCNSESGAIGAYAEAYFGAAVAEANQGIGFYVGSTKSLSITARILRTGGTETGTTSWAGTEKTLWIDEEYFRWDVDPWWSWWDILGRIIDVVSDLVGGGVGTIAEAVQAISLIYDAVELFDALTELLNDDDGTVILIEKDYTFAPGFHTLDVGLRATASGAGIHTGKATTIGQVLSIEIDGIAPPNKPVVTGPSTGTVGTPYEFCAKSNDPNGDDIKYGFVWGDDSNSGWTEYAPSGSPVCRSKSYSEPGEYEIQVWAEDRDTMQAVYCGEHTICIGESCGDDPGNIPPALQFLAPTDPAEPTDPWGDYIIRWIDSDPDDNASIRLYYDTDTAFLNLPTGWVMDSDGQPALLEENSSTDAFCWATATCVDEGTYYIAAVLEDDWHDPVIIYSAGTVEVRHPDPGNHFELADMSQWQWDDESPDNLQDCVNGIPEGLETLEVEIPLRNKSGTDFQFVHATLSSLVSPIDFSEGDNYEDYGSIDAGETVFGHFEFRVTSLSFTDTPFYLNLLYGDASGNTYEQSLPFSYTFPERCSTSCILSAGTPEFLDSDGDGKFESGERIDFWVPISNTGTAACVNPRGILEQSPAWGSPVFSDLSNVYPDIPVGESRSSTNDYDTYYAPRCFAGDIPVTMHFEYGPDRDKVQDVTFTLTVAAAPYMEIGPDTYYFGIAAPGDIVQVEFMIHSDGSAPLEISSITTDNPDTTTNVTAPPLFTIDPCSDQPVTVSINTTDDSGTIERIVTVTSSNAYNENTQTFTITGMVSDCFGEIMIAGGDGTQDQPHIYGNTLVYHEYNGTDSYIVTKDLVTATSTILTPDTNYRHWRPRIYENYVVFAMRPKTGTTNNIEIYLYDLDDIMTPNPKRLTNDDLPDDHPRIWGDYVMWEKRTATDPSTRYDVFLYRISTESTETLTNTPNETEHVAELHGNYAVWINTTTDTIYRRTLSSGSTEQIPKPAEWEDIEEVSNYDNRVVFTAYIDVADPLVDDYYDVFLYDGSLTNISNDHDDIDEEDYITIWGDNVIYMSNYLLYRIEIGVTGPTPFSCDPAMKFTPFIHEDTIVWEDYRNGNPDIYMKSVNTENLAIVPDNISFNTTGPVEGETVTITALINNLGENSQNNVVVRFYAGDPDAGGTQIDSDQTIPTIPAGGMESAAVDWLAATEGSVPIYVVVDPDNAIPENNEVDDNKACKEVPVTDNDTDGPTIDDVGAHEYSGDGDELIEDDEQVWINWTASDPSGIGDSSCTVDGTPYTATGSYEVIVGPFPTGTYNFTIEAQDADNSPESTQEGGSFIVYPHAPIVISVSPPDGDTDVAIRPVVEAEFSEPLDQTTVNNGTVTMQDSSLVLVSGDISYDVVTNTITFVPSDDLSNSETYTMTLLSGEGGICAENGNSLESSFQWSFTTKPDATIPECIISSPVVGQNISGMVEIRGTAWDRNFDSYQVFYGNGSSPSSWTNITSPIGTPVLSNTLCQWDTTGLADGEYSIQLRVHDQPPASNQNVCTIVINIRTTVACVCGDVAPHPNCDGIVNVGDVVLLLNYVGHPGEYQLCCESAGDVAPYPDCDGIINMGDVVLLLNYVGHPGEYEVCCG